MQRSGGPRKCSQEMVDRQVKKPRKRTRAWHGWSRVRPWCLHGEGSV